MPDQDGKTKADEEAIPATSLHGYKEARKDEIKGDTEKLSSSPTTPRTSRYPRWKATTSWSCPTRSIRG